jgi:magnesium transporter
LKKDSSVYNALAYLSNKSADLETINYVYVADGAGKLEGVVSLKDLFRNAKDRGEKSLEDLMTTEMVTVRSRKSQERAAHLALKHGIKSIPVVDKEGKLLGIIPNDKILEIMHQEKVEDLLKFAGIGEGRGNIDDVMTMSWGKSMTRRFPWLLLGTAGGILMAETVSYFESTLRKNILLAAFIPIMVYMSNAVGQQISAFIIRDSSHGSEINYVKYFLKHLGTVFGVGVLLGVIMSAYGYWIQGDPILAVTLGLASFATILSALFSGFLVPFFFIKLNKDPANASGPVNTIIQDILSIIIYFLIASALI